MNGPSAIEESIGGARAARLAQAYDQAVSILALNSRLYVPSRVARLAMIRAMLADGPSHDFDVDRLTLSAIANAGP